MKHKLSFAERMILRLFLERETGISFPVWGIKQQLRLAKEIKADEMQKTLLALTKRGYLQAEWKIECYWFSAGPMLDALQDDGRVVVTERPGVGKRAIWTREGRH